MFAGPALCCGSLHVYTDLLPCAAHELLHVYSNLLPCAAHELLHVYTNLLPCAAHDLLQAAQEKLDGSEERARELYDCNKRLEDHIHDLESRKRAPLYQKKQVRLEVACCL